MKNEKDTFCKDSQFIDSFKGSDRNKLFLLLVHTFDSLEFMLIYNIF